jgi:hypothetical protein
MGLYVIIVIDGEVTGVLKVTNPTIWPFDAESWAVLYVDADIHFIYHA